MTDPCATLSARLGLNYEPGTQDWDLSAADCSRIGEFVTAYRDPTVSEGEKYWLGWLLLASWQQLFETLTSPETLAAARSLILGILERDYALHRKAIEYWKGRSDRSRVGAILKNFLLK